MQDEPGQTAGPSARSWPPASAAPPRAPADSPGPLNPWISIWTRPRATMRRILDTDPRRMVFPLVLIAGVVAALGVVPSLPQFVPMITAAGRVAAFAVCLVVCPLAGLIGLYLMGWLISVTGGWLEGSGDGVAVRAAMAWSNVPAIWGGLLLIPRYMTLDTQPVDPADLLHNPGALFMEGILGMLGFILVIWQIVILLKCIGEAHGFSAWRALGACILALILLCVGVGMAAALLAVVVAGLR